MKSFDVSQPSFHERCVFEHVFEAFIEPSALVVPDSKLHVASAFGELKTKKCLRRPKQLATPSQTNPLHAKPAQELTTGLDLRLRLHLPVDRSRQLLLGH
jgi:hypothetical protein